MKKSQKGFSVIEVLIFLVIVVALGAVGWKVYQSQQQNDSTFSLTTGTPQNPNDLYRGNVTTWLSGATDDDYINYYHVKYSLDDIHVSCDDKAHLDTVSKYEGRKLTIDIYARTEQLPENPCLYLDVVDTPHPPSGQVDINKEWLQQGGTLELIIAGKKRTIEVDIAKRTWSIEPSKQMPFYPDKIAVLAAFPCDQDVKQNLINFATQHNLTQADAQYPGLDGLYVRPTKELHIIYNEAAIQVEQEYEQTHAPARSPLCTPRVAKPILIHHLGAEGLLP